MTFLASLRLVLVILFGILSLARGAAAAADPIYTGFLSDTAVGGYDTVAYHTEGRAVEGSSEHATAWRGATWHFASAGNLARFEADPERYAPQYGGYCAYAVAKGATAKGDPEVCKIVDGRLYLNLNRDVARLWEQDIPGYIAKADANWPGVLE
jgi:YHS domain-containing protein